MLAVIPRGVALTTHPNLAPRLKEEYSYTSTSPLSLYDLLIGRAVTFTNVRNLK